MDSYENLYSKAPRYDCISSSHPGPKGCGASEKPLEAETKIKVSFSRTSLQPNNHVAWYTKESIPFIYVPYQWEEVPIQTRELFAGPRQYDDLANAKVVTEVHEDGKRHRLIEKFQKAVVRI